MNKLARRKSLFPSFDNMFDRFFGDWMDDPYWGLTIDTHSNKSPTIKTSSDEKGYYIKGDVPGFDDKDINIEVKNNIITFSGKIENKSEKDGRFISDTRSFNHSYSLPNDVIIDDISADLKNGILLITIPRKKIKKKEIPIKKIEVNKA